ncbi:MAG: RraA family protein [Planctomycetota bacterium]
MRAGGAGGARRPARPPAPDPGKRLAGRALPARHSGSVDVFLEASGTAEPGDVLVVDNGGRTDEGCIGDLTVLEARACGVAGALVWGCHRDTEELLRIGFPVHSRGANPAGPRRAEPREADALRVARVGEHPVTREDLVFADADGALFVAAREVERILGRARTIAGTERRQAEAIGQGRTLRDQLRFEEFLRKRAADPALPFRSHLRAIGGAVEE